MAQSTIDSDDNLPIRLILHDIFNKANTLDELYNRHVFDEALTKITNLIAQEANKARIDELNQLQDDIDNYPVYKPIKTARLAATELVQNRIAQLKVTADKETDNG